MAHPNDTHLSPAENHVDINEEDMGNEIDSAYATTNTTTNSPSVDSGNHNSDKSSYTGTSSGDISPTVIYPTVAPSDEKFREVWGSTLTRDAHEPIAIVGMGMSP